MPALCTAALLCIFAPAADAPGRAASAGPAPAPATEGRDGPEAEPDATDEAEPDATDEAEPDATDEAEPIDAGATDETADAADDADASDDDASDDETAEAADEPGPTPVAAGKPPRIDGAYVGGIVGFGVALVRVNDLTISGPFTAFGGSFRFGEYVLPWLGLGLSIGGGGGVRAEDGARQQLGQGQLAVDFNFVPAPKRLNLQLRASFGFGGGAVREADVPGRAGFGGAVFGAAARYEWFPLAAKRRPYRGGGFGIGPELGWLGFTPAASGRPMSNTIYLALATTFYFGS